MKSDCHSPSTLCSLPRSLMQCQSLLLSMPLPYHPTDWDLELGGVTTTMKTMCGENNPRKPLFDPLKLQPLTTVLGWALEPMAHLIVHMTAHKLLQYGVESVDNLWVTGMLLAITIALYAWIVRASRVDGISPLRGMQLYLCTIGLVYCWMGLMNVLMKEQLPAHNEL